MPSPADSLWYFFTRLGSTCFWYQVVISGNCCDSTHTDYIKSHTNKGEKQVVFCSLSGFSLSGECQEILLLYPDNDESVKAPR